MHKSFLLLTSFLIIQACKPTTESSYHFRGANARDHAELTLTIINEDFYGKYTILKDGHPYRTGDLQGKIQGDTLIGDYYYLSHGDANKKRIAIAFLKQGDSTLIQGFGVTTTYMGIPYFVPTIPLNFENSDFILKITE